MSEIGTRRLRNQLVLGNQPETPRNAVATLGAVQAQDYLGALWAVGLRMHAGGEEDVERALEERSIVRTWPLRGTLHFVAAEDVRWMIELLAGRIVRRHAARQEREHGLNASVLRRSRDVVKDALQGGRQLTRPEIYAALEKRRIAAGAQAGLQILWHLAHQGLICFGPRRGKQQTFVLLDEWLPAGEPMAEEDALAELARRYFVGHGPATVEDFAWWSGLPPAIAKKALESASPHLAQDKTYWFSPAERHPRSSANVHLLPPFDELTVGYRDRSAVLDTAFARSVNAGGGMLQAVVMVNGMVSGTWKRELARERVRIRAAMFRPLKRNEKRNLEAACERYARFVGATSAELSVS